MENRGKQAELQQQAAELKMQTLRTQMNPHFIFNCLNSINRFILENNKPDSSRYLNKFSKLIRMILQNSQSSYIPLKSELESLVLYIEMEMMVTQSFQLQNNYSSDLDISKQITATHSPALCENAVWHGLMHKEKKANW